MLRNGLKVLLLAVTLTVGYGLGVLTGPQVTGRPGGGDRSKENGKKPRPPRTAIGVERKREPAQGTVAVMAHPQDGVKELFVKLNDKVKKGETVLVRLASWDDRKKERDLANEQVAEAERQRDAIEKAKKARLAELE